MKRSPLLGFLSGCGLRRSILHTVPIDLGEEEEEKPWLLKGSTMLADALETRHGIWREVGEHGRRKQETKRVGLSVSPQKSWCLTRPPGRLCYASG